MSRAGHETETEFARTRDGGERSHDQERARNELLALKSEAAESQYSAAVCKQHFKNAYLEERQEGDALNGLAQTLSTHGRNPA